MFRNLGLVVCIFSVFVFGSTVVFSEDTVVPATPAFAFQSYDANGSLTAGAINFNDVNPGDVLEGIFVLTLLDDVNAQFYIDITFFDSQSNDLSSWFNFSEEHTSRFILEKAGDSIEIPYTMVIPNDILISEYKGMIRAVLASYSSQEDPASGITVTTASGIEFFINFSGIESEYLVDVSGFEIEDWDHKSDSFLVSATFENKGNKIVTPQLNVVATNYKGDVVYDNVLSFKDLIPFAGSVRDSASLPSEILEYFPWVNLDFELFYLYNDENKIEVRESLLTASTRISVYSSYIIAFIIFIVFSIIIFVYKKNKKT